MRKFLNKISLFLMGLVLCVASVSCGNKSYNEMTPEQQQKEYVQFQNDSVKFCTETPSLAEAAVKGAFDRIPENNGYYKIDKVDVNYDNELNCWVGTVNYHVDRNNTYYENTAVFHGDRRSAAGSDCTDRSRASAYYRVSHR